MGDYKVIGPCMRHALYKADSGGIRFQMKTAGSGPEITLTAADAPLPLFTIILGHETKIIDSCQENEIVETYLSTSLTTFLDFKEFWLTWYNNKIQMGLVGEPKPFVVYNKLHTEQKVRFIQFNTLGQNSIPVEWIIETSPVILKPVSCKRFEDNLHWIPMTNGQLPLDAMIGGFEKEITYIARSHHNNSICPGKYLPSTGLAYVPWGGREHYKRQFEILCGYNGKWVEARSNQIPPNAFIGGYSEVHHEPLYICRAMIDGKLICGKAHARYHLCYLPYHGREVETTTYEILVVPENAIPQAIPSWQRMNKPLHFD